MEVEDLSSGRVIPLWFQSEARVFTQVMSSTEIAFNGHEGVLQLSGRWLEYR